MTASKRDALSELLLSSNILAERQGGTLESMRISARNHIRGIVVEVKKGATTSHVRVDIGGNILTSSITNEAVDELGIKVNDCVALVIKASDVMVAVD